MMRRNHVVSEVARKVALLSLALSVFARVRAPAGLGASRRRARVGITGE